MTPPFENPKDIHAELAEIQNMIRDTKEEIQRLKEELEALDSNDASRELVEEKLASTTATLETLLFDEADKQEEMRNPKQNI